MTETTFSTGLPVSTTETGADAKAKAAAAAGVAQDQAGQLAGAAKDQAGEVIGTAKEQAANVIGDATEQARSLLAEAQTELTTQAVVQRDKAVSGLRELSRDLSSMAQNTEAQGVASHLVAEAGRRSGTVAEFLAEREPGHLLEELRGLGRRRTGAFLLGAAVLGFAGGRLLKGARADSDNAPTDSDNAPTTRGSETQAVPGATAFESPFPVQPSAAATYGSLAHTPHLLPDDNV